MMNMQKYSVRIINIVSIFLLLYLVLNEYFSSVQTVLNPFSIIWLIFLFIIALLGVFLVIFVNVSLNPSLWLRKPLNYLLWLRSKLGLVRWLIIFFSLCIAVYFFQYTHWGGIFTTPFLRLMVFLSLVCWVSFWLCHEENQWASYKHGIAALIITGSFWIAVVNLRTVTDFPFALSWSEGNRIWDYSIPFGRALYDYPPDKPIFVYTDLARRLIFGLPFLLPQPTIEVVRLWMALVSFVPYAILGWLVLKGERGKGLYGLLGGLWLFAFLYQGGVYAPLMIAAILVVIACWYSPLWLGVLLQGAASYLVLIGRINWVVAPVVWATLLTILLASNGESYAAQKDRDNIFQHPILRAFFLVLAASFYLVYSHLSRYYNLAIKSTDFIQLANQFVHDSYSYIVTFMIGVLLFLLAIYYRKVIFSFWKNYYARVAVIFTLLLFSIVGIILFSDRVFAQLLAGQSLLWQRLLPNPTHPLGILLLLLIAVLPLGIFLFTSYQRKIWTLPPYGSWLIIFSLGVFLIIGLIVSVKIGGGNNLHNMDLFMITCVLTAGIAWRNGLDRYITTIQAEPLLIKAWFVLVLFIPFVHPLQEMRPLELPSMDYTLNALNQVRIEVEEARSKGEVLFIDQRQLLTFGYVKAPLVVEYEKKLLQDRALSANQAYFEPFYNDLEKRRFALIISSPLKVDYKPINDSGEMFGEENRAWTQWVAEPLLRYYKPRWTFKKIGMQLLVPIDETN